MATRHASILATFLLTLVACGGGASPVENSAVSSASGTTAGSGESGAAIPSTPANIPALTGNKNLFYSGHSLIDNPLPDYVESIASSLGRRTLWNQQNVIGSPIRARTRGFDMNDPNWGGYRLGKNREGSGMNVINELRNPQTLGGQRYDALILAERHDLPMEFESTVRYARHQHERLIEGNPQATTFVFHGWQYVKDKSNPAPWMAYERAAAPAWQCVASRINTSLAGEGRSDRMQHLPSGLALVELVDRATRGQVDGLSGGSTLETMNRIFFSASDDVHLSRPLGVYYMALVTYASVYRSSPQGAWVPDGMPAAQARSLQDLAWSVVSNYYANPVNTDPASCAAYMREQFCARLYSWLGASQGTSGCIANFAASSSVNPFYYNAATDRSYWAPAP